MQVLGPRAPEGSGGSGGSEGEGKDALPKLLFPGLLVRPSQSFEGASGGSCVSCPTVQLLRRSKMVSEERQELRCQVVICRQGEDAQNGKKFLLKPGDLIRLGKGVTNDIVLNYEGVSKHHAEIFLQEPQEPGQGLVELLSIRDQGSKNGSAIQRAHEEGAAPNPWDKVLHGTPQALQDGLHLLIPHKSRQGEKQMTTDDRMLTLFVSSVSVEVPVVQPPAVVKPVFGVQASAQVQAQAEKPPAAPAAPAPLQPHQQLLQLRLQQQALQQQLQKLQHIKSPQKPVQPAQPAQPQPVPVAPTASVSPTLGDAGNTAQAAMKDKAKKKKKKAVAPGEVAAAVLTQAVPAQEEEVWPPPLPRAETPGLVGLAAAQDGDASEGTLVPDDDALSDPEGQDLPPPPEATAVQVPHGSAAQGPGQRVLTSPRPERRRQAKPVEVVLSDEDKPKGAARLSEAPGQAARLSEANVAAVSAAAAGAAGMQEPTADLDHELRSISDISTPGVFPWQAAKKFGKKKGRAESEGNSEGRVVRKKRKVELAEAGAAQRKVKVKKPLLTAAADNGQRSSGAAPQAWDRESPSPQAGRHGTRRADMSPDRWDPSGDRRGRHQGIKEVKKSRKSSPERRVERGDKEKKHKEKDKKKRS
ncbi:unnamed protein product [Polarella glacialis]|uniref:FHA domain-containing protein n=1 Tax=Polarella glacialis TaxID=89957 RepID=A0A813LNT3_POLGL|nr:unnamed protein product [Polarella glacialis]